MNRAYVLDFDSFTDLIRDEHAALLERFDEFRESTDAGVRQRIADELFEALEIHLRLEDEVLHPIAGRLFEDTRAFAVVLRGDVEHELLRTLVDRLRGLYVTEAEFGACLVVLEGHLQQHVWSEEDDLLPELEGHVSQAGLAAEWRRRRGRLTAPSPSP